MSKPIALSWRPFYKGLMWWLFGRVDFAEREEYQEFRYKLVIVLMASAALVTGFFILGTLSAVNPISPAHQKSMIFFTASLPATSSGWTFWALAANGRREKRKRADGKRMTPEFTECLGESIGV